MLKYIKIKIRNSIIYSSYFKLWIIFNEFFLKNSKLFKNHKSVLPFYLISKCLILSKNYNFLYFRIPKAANSSVILNLHAAIKGGGINIKSKEEMNDLKKLYLNNQPKIHLFEYSKIINDYWKFSVVRNPYNRLLSAYLDKIIGCRPQKMWVTSFLKCHFYEFISLEKFIYYLECGGIKDDIHWALQTEIIFIPIDKIDFIGRVENLKQDMQFITKKIFGKNLDMQNFRLNKTDSVLKIDGLLTNDLKKRIYKIYEKDFKLLGYLK
jgi:hypothetical protein